jgi:'Cold-shock' DNA-binding domain
MSGNMQRLRGKVAWFDPGKGFGFITRDDGQPDLFFMPNRWRAAAGKSGPVMSSNSLLSRTRVGCVHGTSISSLRRW